MILWPTDLLKPQILWGNDFLYFSVRLKFYLIHYEMFASYFFEKRACKIRSKRAQKPGKMTSFCSYRDEDAAERSSGKHKGPVVMTGPFLT
jgi:hypothetical protein